MGKHVIGYIELPTRLFWTTRWKCISSFFFFTIKYKDYSQLGKATNLGGITEEKDKRERPQHALQVTTLAAT